MEILFEQDNEEKSVATLILDTLVKVQKVISVGLDCGMCSPSVQLMMFSLLYLCLLCFSIVSGTKSNVLWSHGELPDLFPGSKVL